MPASSCPSHARFFMPGSSCPLLHARSCPVPHTRFFMPVSSCPLLHARFSHRNCDGRYNLPCHPEVSSHLCSLQSFLGLIRFHFKINVVLNLAVLHYSHFKYSRGTCAASSLRSGLVAFSPDTVLIVLQGCELQGCETCPSSSHSVNSLWPSILLPPRGAFLIQYSGESFWHHNTSSSCICWRDVTMLLCGLRTACAK